MAIAYKVLERATALLGEGELTIATAFGGPGARDAFTLATGQPPVVDPALRRPERGPALERFVFRVSSGERSETLVLREGFVTDEFARLAFVSERSTDEEARLAVLKRELADRVMAAAAEDVVDSA